MAKRLSKRQRNILFGKKGIKEIRKPSIRFNRNGTMTLTRYFKHKKTKTKSRISRR